MANTAPMNVSARQNDRVLPPALNVARADQKVRTPSATVASATSVALGSTESVSHSGLAPPNCARRVALVISMRCGDSIATIDAGSDSACTPIAVSSAISARSSERHGPRIANVRRDVRSAAPAAIARRGASVHGLPPAKSR